MFTINVCEEDFESAKKIARWGTYGKNGDQPLTYVRLIDCSTDHLKAILRTQEDRTDPEYVKIIKSILDDRVK